VDERSEPNREELRVADGDRRSAVIPVIWIETADPGEPPEAIGEALNRLT
jgi:hypothetical protein